MKKQNFKKMMNLRSFALIAIFAVAVFATSCNKADDGYIPEDVAASQDLELKKGKPDNVGPKGAPAPGEFTIAEIVVASANPKAPNKEAEFTLLLAALEYTNLTGVFTGGGQYTVFAPTDQAFINLATTLGVDPSNPFEEIDNLLGEGTVANVLLYHVTEGRRAANSVVPPRGTKTIETLLEGASFSVFTEDGNVFIDAIGNEAQILATNISASNGIVHEINTVLLPL
ncbi:Uncaracterized surface protein containing fasciclin (FAS1) repeats [Tangfeifania diversioriginum]|uniref:Uncaracterized surface protein containing fasciclin (FAS1) repeats n=1 Tax=Tangfeifania diversioriginum TaxID=1168035 RepID=A0A1M6KGR3_9BACT|nr:fasciclin domain-containing protein [Tangfeifania diversioriginum]SHJ58135.1 Uncaracterized surface protein containing fasciclin (FAS1) repeats [Tangfeifania diversioriginum]